MGIININCMGDACPVPVVKTIKAINAMTEPGLLVVQVDNETAVKNIRKLAAGKAFPVSVDKKSDEDYRVSIQVERIGNAMPEEASCDLGQGESTVVAIASRGMGHGSEELAATLMKGFIYALSQQAELPSAIIFYNGGVYNSCEGSVSVEDLKNMEAQGVEILSCGTCLDYFGLKDKLAVGRVSNMYDIVEWLMKADKVIKQ